MSRGPRVAAVLLIDPLAAEAVASTLQLELQRRGRTDLSVVNADVVGALDPTECCVLITDHQDAGSAKLFDAVAGGVPRIHLSDENSVEMQSSKSEVVTAARQGGIASLADVLCEMIAGIPEEAAGVFDRDADFVAAVGRLTPRKREVLVLLAEGHSVDSIARRSGRSSRTISNLKYELIRELNVRTAAELVRMAIRCGLVQA